MIAIPTHTVASAIRHFDTDITRFKAGLKSHLQRLYADGRIKGNRKKYLKQLLNISDNLVTAKPATLNKYRKIFERIIPGKTMRTASHKAFRDRVLTALGYSKRRVDFYPHYFQRIGIKTCVYCNAQLAVSVEKRTVKKKRSVKAKFQVDHYWPKSEYPCFSISLFNLYPACANCNGSKGTTRVDFALYDDRRSASSRFRFALDPGTIVKYLTSRKSDDITFTFSEPKPARNCKTFRETFDIQGIYDTQRDVAEELILKGEIYSPSYKLYLAGKFRHVLNSADIANRLMLGNYPHEKDILKRPMAKFTLDLARQIGLI
jgi:5-methylcytosine-specific restriction endonuclease McrA